MMYKHFYSVIAAAALVLAGCSNADDIVGANGGENTPDPVVKEYNDFSFSTENANLSVNLSYNLRVKTSVYFELFDEEPGTWEEGKYYKKDGVTPLYAGFTDENGAFASTITMPSYVTKLYAYSPYFIATSILEANVEGNTVNFVDNGVSMSLARTLSRAPLAGVTNKCYLTCPVEEANEGYKNDKRWYDWLVEYDNNGRVQNRFSGEPGLPLIAEDSLAKYLKTHLAVFPVDRNSFPEKYIKQADIQLTKPTELAITVIGGNTCWHSSLGYYYYPEGTTPTSLNDVNVVLIFPNTQDGFYPGSQNYIGAAHGDCVKLMYYPEIASGSKANATTVFPAGYRIGFVLAANGWSNRLTTKGDFKKDRKQRSATSAYVSIDQNGNPYAKPMSAVYNVNGQVLVSFEDDGGWDKNYSDFIVTFQTKTVDATGPTPAPEYNTILAQQNLGFYAFEDQWPSKGDYDMNDVIFNATYHKLYSTENNAIYEEGYTFKTFTNEARAEALQSGIALVLKGLVGTDELQCMVKKPGKEEFEETQFEYDTKNKVLYLTSNVKGEVGTEYRINVKHSAQLGTLYKDKKITVSPFVYRDVEGKRLEIHLPKEAPTALADKSFFGTEDDCSDVANKIYYVRKGNYPFAFYLSGATEKDVQKLLNKDNERHAISESFSKYKSWVESNGGKDKNWYKVD